MGFEKIGTEALETAKKVSESLKIEEIDKRINIHETKIKKETSVSVDNFIDKRIDNRNKNFDINIKKEPIDFSKIVEDINPITKWMESIKEVKDILENDLVKEISNINNKLKNPHISKKTRLALEGRLRQLKGEALERFTKKIMESKGITTLENKETNVGGGQKTKPDYYGVNNTKHDIYVFGRKVKPGETVYVECKTCGEKSLKIEFTKSSDLPKQLRFKADHKFLLTTNDIDKVPKTLKYDLCRKNNVNIVSLNLSAGDFEKVLRSV